MLGYPVLNEPFVLHCDASQEGLGAVRYQSQGGKLVVISYRLRASQEPPEKKKKKETNIFIRESLSF